MNVLLTAVYGRCGTAIIDHLHDGSGYGFTDLDRNEPDDDTKYSEYDTVVVDVANGAAVRNMAINKDTMIHLAGIPSTMERGTTFISPTSLGY